MAPDSGNMRVSLALRYNSPHAWVNNCDMVVVVTALFALALSAR